MNSRFLQRVDMTGLVLTILLTIGWAVATNGPAAASVAIGGAIGLLNMIVIRTVLGNVVRRMADGDTQSPVLGGLFLAKFAAMGIVVFLLVAVVRVDVIALAAGMSMVPLAILLEFVRWHLSATPSEPHADA